MGLSISITCAAQSNPAAETQQITVRLLDCRSGAPYADKFVTIAFFHAANTPKPPGAKNANTLYVPRLAIFQKDGKQTVYLKKSSGFEQLQVKVGAQNESRTAIDGLKEGDQVALIDPTAPRKSSNSGSASPLGGGNL